MQSIARDDAIVAAGRNSRVDQFQAKADAEMEAFREHLSDIKHEVKLVEKKMDELENKVRKSCTIYFIDRLYVS